MKILAPSILAADFANLGDCVKRVERAGAQYIHIDVMDGVFVPSISFGVPIVTAVRSVTDLHLDVHLMIVQPERYLEVFAEAGADGITVHWEACEDPSATFHKIRSLGKKVGVSLRPGTAIGEIYPYLELLDMVLIMTVEPGFGGQKYMEACTEKIVALREEIRVRGLNVDIEVDGGVHRGNVCEILQAGANVIVTGSALFRGDVEENVRYFLEQMNATN